APAIEHVHLAAHGIQQASDRDRGCLELDDRDIRIRTVERPDTFARKADPEIFRCILDTERYGGLLRNRAEEAYKLGLRHTLCVRRLENRPFSTERRCRLHELDLPANAQLAHGDGKRST